MGLIIDGVVLMMRLVTGRDLDGGRRTNARWAHPGTATRDGHEHVHRRFYASHRKRSAYRVSALLVLAVLAYGAATDVLSTLTLLRLAFWWALATALWVAWEWTRRYTHRREVVAPLGEALASHLGDDRYVLDPRAYIRVPVEPLDRPTRILLPRTYSPSDAQEKALVRLVGRKIGLVAPSHTIELKGEEPFVEVRPAPAPRDIVTFAQADVRALVEAAPEGHLLLGLGPRDVPVYVDLEAESPHVAFSMATGAGKSVAGRALAMQVLHGGGLVLVLDRKVESQLWAAQLPNVRYACSCPEVYAALMDMSGEIDRRFELVRERALAGRPISREEMGPRLLIIAEEINALEVDMRLWWRAIRDKEDPVQCPALPVLGRLLFMGRAGRTHLDVIAQKLTCQAIGGPAARENLSTRVLGRATTSTWNMLAPECKVGGKYPRSSRHRGRVHVVIGDEATPTQILFATDEEAQDYATSGVVTPFPSMDRKVREAGSATVLPAGTPVDEVPHLRPVPDEVDDEPRSTLAEFSTGSGIPLKALQNARDRSASFPEPVESGRGRPSRYRDADLERWADERAVSVVSTGPGSAS